jgi:hypothetical protein
MIGVGSVYNNIGVHFIRAPVRFSIKHIDVDFLLLETSTCDSANIVILIFISISLSKQFPTIKIDASTWIYFF